METKTAKISAGYTALGALVGGDAALFRVWSPNARRLHVVMAVGDAYPMTSVGNGYFEARVEGASHGSLYRIRLNDDADFPDPASRYQPEGVHGPSMVVDPMRYAWRDQSWKGVPREQLVFYELHVGTFSTEGTFDGVRSHLSYLKDLGVTAVELMPVADFPGRWNWGYDHAALYAPSRAYGTPDDLRRLVDDAHDVGLAVYLDVIYNHLGPDGAYVGAFCPMFTDKHQTPWGHAINLDDRNSEGVRNLLIDNALMWLREYHFDGLRLDAVHAIVDDSEPNFLTELKSAVEKISDGPDRLLVAEDSRNLNAMILPRGRDGFGLDAVWVDDFHHQVRNLTAGDDDGYFVDFAETTAADLARTINRGWFFEGQTSRQSGKPRGTDASPIDRTRCVVCIQNHDQIGNRPHGDRLHHAVSLPMYRAATTLLLFVPELPLLFMGQEWAASTPFQFFTDHNAELGKLVSEGRRTEFGHFAGFADEIPDPQDPETFERSRLRWQEQRQGEHARTLNLYRDLLAFRGRLDGFDRAEAVSPRALRVTRGSHQLLVSFSEGERIPMSPGAEIVLHTENETYASGGQAPDFVDGSVLFRVPGAVILATNPG